jgi:diguanylate cyclase
MTASATVSALDDIDFEYATSVAQQAQALMARHRVPPTPDNFAVWFKYAFGASPQLKQAIDVLIGNKREFDTATNRDLFRAYVGGQAARAVDLGVSEQLSALMSGAQQFLAAAIDDNRMQMRALDGVCAEVSNDGDPRRLIESLVQELSRAAHRATALETNFAKASIELDKIRDSLEQAEHRSKTDMLTGLANRRALDEFLETEQIRAMESGAPLSAFLIDIDNFKSFNDSYGHPVGDQVLKLMAAVLREHVRDNDLAVRYGGEELLAVLPGRDLAACRRIADRVRGVIAERRIRRRTTGEEIASITISVGVAQFRPGESADSLIERCDRALYLAKRQGRNRVLTERDYEGDIAAA